MTIAVGDRLGRYELISIVGTGGMGIVFEARDPELDRIVAVKVLRGTADTEAEDRLRREGQTMARLTHPNVIRVYDVGVERDHPFVAMEFVDGGTLDDWLAAAPRTAREVVRVFVEAGRGLAAAHAATLVHRDFTPANVLVGKDGRVLVTDFGLARTAAAQAGDVDARVDQFGFCVALWRALFGAPPYAGGDVAIVPPKPEAERRATPRVRRALERGLSGDPDRRFRSMDDLLAAIEARPTRARTWALGGAGAAVVVAGVAWIAIGSRASEPEPDPCPVPAERVMAVWNQKRADALRERLVEIDPATGRERFSAARAMVGHAMPAWIELHVAACRATRVERTQPDAVLDARMRCLDGWLARANAVIGGLEAAGDAKQLEAAIRRLGGVPAIDGCDDSKALAGETELPAAPAQRAEATALLAELELIDRERTTTKLDGLVERSDAAVARARSLDSPPLLTRALGMRWRVAQSTGDMAGSLRVVDELTGVAARAGDNYEEARAWALKARLTANIERQPDEAEVMIGAARAAAARAGDPPRLLIDVLTSHAEVLNIAGDYARALAVVGEVRQLLAALGAEQPGSPYAVKLAGALRTTARVYWHDDKQADAIPPLREAIALYDRAYGPDTTDSAAARLELAQLLRELGRYQDAEREARDGARVTEALTGESAGLAIYLATLADALGFQERRAEALVAAERASAIAKKSMRPGGPQQLMIEIELASHYDGAGQTREALAIYERALAAVEAADVVDINVVAWWLNRADVEYRLGMCRESIAHYRKAGELGRAIQGDTSDYLGSALRGEADCLVKLGKQREAIAVLERSQMYEHPPYLALDVALARGTLGRLIADTRRGAERARGIAMVRDALAEIATIDDPDVASDETRAALVAWLAKQRR